MTADSSAHHGGSLQENADKAADSPPHLASNLPPHFPRLANLPCLLGGDMGSSLCLMALRRLFLSARGRLVIHLLLPCSQRTIFRSGHLFAQRLGIVLMKNEVTPLMAPPFSMSVMCMQLSRMDADFLLSLCKCFLSVSGLLLEDPVSRPDPRWPSERGVGTRWSAQSPLFFVLLCVIRC